MEPIPSPAAYRRPLVTSSELINVLGVVYVHKKTEGKGEMYLTRFGHELDDWLKIENWYEKEWFEKHRERLIGTSCVYRVPTKEVNGRSVNLVVKYSRVGEDIPINTQVLEAFVNAEFNSPWEEFALVMEMRDGSFGPKEFRIRTQRPLAIYVPPEPMQLWQTGRSRHRINKIIQKHPGLSLDILRQYVLVYEWIEGLNVIETLESIGCDSTNLDGLLAPITWESIAHMETKGYAVADMKPSHIIVGESHVRRLHELTRGPSVLTRQIEIVQDTIARKDYSVIDYELLQRTPVHEQQVKQQRRHSYLDDQRHRFDATAPLPPYLHQVEILGVPYVHGHAESTGGMLWVVGRNPRLFDYFVPERWRRTPCRQLSANHEIYYTLTKDAIHIVWKASRVGELPGPDEDPARLDAIRELGFNSPFEVCAIAHELSQNGVPTAYMRAIYMTGSEKLEPVTDARRYDSHRAIVAMDGRPVLREERNYVTIRGFFNGTDDWVATHEGQFCQPIDLQKAANEALLPRETCAELMAATLDRLKNLDYDGDLLEWNDLLLAIDPRGHIVLDAAGRPEARICNLELIHRR